MRAQRGTILIEHIVAIVVLALVVTGVLSLLSTGYLSAGMAQELSLATNLAQRRLEEIKAAGCEAAVSLPRQPVDASRFRGYEWEVEKHLNRAVALVGRAPGVPKVLTLRAFGYPKGQWETLLWGDGKRNKSPVSCIEKASTGKRQP